MSQHQAEHKAKKELLYPVIMPKYFYPPHKGFHAVSTRTAFNGKTVHQAMELLYADLFTGLSVSATNGNYTWPG